MISEKELLIKAKAGSNEAFEEIVNLTDTVEILEEAKKIPEKLRGICCSSDFDNRKEFLAKNKFSKYFVKEKILFLLLNLLQNF